MKMMLVDTTMFSFSLLPSTYSTLYNHPTRIVEPRTKASDGGGGGGRNDGKEINLSRKTGMPLGVIPGPLPKENHPIKGEWCCERTCRLYGLYILALGVVHTAGGCTYYRGYTLRGVGFRGCTYCRGVFMGCTYCRGYTLQGVYM